ncbi:hypothetical protein MKZ38_010632 [Zalerion maritima]|uniref:Uncharacterized protein n=1 Tax=Zalerion maritima TaxID=339359 RepID=A0AAD5RGG7_9PEZI|nr:hypothetical protein MKZ38_010632 [Zalerion maritima]
MSLHISGQQERPEADPTSVRFRIHPLARRHHHKHRDPAHHKFHEALDWTRSHLTATEIAPTHTPSHTYNEPEQQKPVIESDPSRPSSLFAQPTTPALSNGIPFDQPHIHPLSSGQTEIDTLAGGTAILVFLLFLIVFLGVQGNKDVYDNRVGVAATLRRRRFFYERWRVPTLRECAQLSRRGSEVLSSISRSRRSSVTSAAGYGSGFEYPVFGQQVEVEDDGDDQVSSGIEGDAWWAETTHNMAKKMRTETPHPEDLFVVPAYDISPTATISTFGSSTSASERKSYFDTDSDDEEEEEEEDEGPVVISPKATRKSIIQCIAEWEAQEEEKYEKLLARVQEEEMEKQRWRQVERGEEQRGRTRSVSRGRSHSRTRLAGRKMTVSGVPGEPEMDQQDWSI